MPEYIVDLALASCNTRHATVEKDKAHKSWNWKSEPAFVAVVTVPGPMNAAEIIDQNRMLRILLQTLFKPLNFIYL
jgi:hypothetical protein